MDMLWYGVFVAKWDALQVERMVTVAWALWTSRNEVWTRGAKKNVRKIVNNALEYLAEYQAAFVGVLVRDAASKTIGALSKKIWAPLKAVEVEAKAVETGLQFTKDLLIHDFILESDSLLMTNALKELSLNCGCYYLQFFISF